MTLLTRHTARSVTQDSQTLPSLFISHGAPTLALEDNAFTHALASLGQQLPRPQFIVVMSAHWETRALTINANPAPTTWHDFGGFSKALFDIQYPAPGDPHAAFKIAKHLQSAGLTLTVVHDQPFDHGVWTPLVHMYPQADMPIVQISLPYGFGAQALFELGQLLAPLRHEQVLIIASGSVTHNLRQVRLNSGEIEPSARQFKYHLMDALTHYPDLDKATDHGHWCNWQHFPLAQHNHPTPEHLLPVFFARGAGTRMTVVQDSFAHYSLGMDIYRFD